MNFPPVETNDVSNVLISDAHSYAAARPTWVFHLEVDHSHKQYKEAKATVYLVAYEEDAVNL